MSRETRTRRRSRRSLTRGARTGAACRASSLSALDLRSPFFSSLPGAFERRPDRPSRPVEPEILEHVGAGLVLRIRIELEAGELAGFLAADEDQLGPRVVEELRGVLQ